MSTLRKYFASLLMLLAGLINGQSNTNRPNILWIVAEDLSPDLSVYGDNVATTPNIDKLAARGTVYTSLYATAPICSASRSAIITGCYQTAIGAHNHRTLTEEKKWLPKGVNPITKYFKESGYFTVIASAVNKQQSKIPGSYGSGKTDFNFVFDQSETVDSYTWKDCPDDQPFFAMLTLKQTHRGEWWQVGEKRKNSTIIKDIPIPPYYPDNKVSHEVFSAYYDAIQVLDQHVGEAIDELKKEGKYENTIIIFTSDHGRPMPRGKQFCYENGLHVPLIISGIGIEKGETDERLLSSLDLTASMLAIADAKVTGIIHGNDFVRNQSYERRFVIGARDRCDETVHRIRSVKSKRFNYIRNYYYENPYTAQNRYKDTNYPILKELRRLKESGDLTLEQSLFMANVKPKEELYDLENDPHELNNLATDPSFKAILDEMRINLADWLIEYKDYGAERESEAVMEKIIEARIKKYGY